MSQWKTEIKQVDHKVTVVNIVYKTIWETETKTKVFVEFRATLSASLNCYCGNKPPTNMWLLWPTSSLEFWAEDILSLAQLLDQYTRRTMTTIFDILYEGRSCNTFTFYAFRPDFRTVMKKGTIITSPNCFCGMCLCVIWPSQRPASES